MAKRYMINEEEPLVIDDSNFFRAVYDRYMQTDWRVENNCLYVNKDRYNNATTTGAFYYDEVFDLTNYSKLGFKIKTSRKGYPVAAAEPNCFGIACLMEEHRGETIYDYSSTGYYDFQDRMISIPQGDTSADFSGQYFETDITSLTGNYYVGFIGSKDFCPVINEFYIATDYKKLTVWFKGNGTFIKLTPYHKNGNTLQRMLPYNK